MGMNTDAVQRLYVAYFNRPADPVSMSVYESLLPTDRVATQAELQALAETYFSPSTEYQSMYAGKSNTQIVDQLYQNIFGRAAEVDGLVYWAAELTAGRQTVASIALQLSYSAQGTDANVVSNRIEAANSFTESLDTSAEITGYSGDAAAASARAWLATVGSDDASKDAAISGVDAAVSDAVSAGSADASKAFTLTTGRDDFVGGTGADTFDATAATLSAGDELDGGDGTDTLTIADNVGGLNIAMPSVTVKDIENLVVTTTGAVGVAAVAGVTGVDAVAQIRSITPTVTTAGSTATLTVTYGTASFTTSALDGSVTVAEINALVKAALNVMAGSDVADIADGRVVVTSPTAGTPIPAITITPSAATATFAQADIVANVVGVDAVDAVTAAPYDISGFTGLTDVDLDAAGNVNIKGSATADIDALTTAGSVTVTGGKDQTITSKGGFVSDGAAGTVIITETAQAAVNSAVDGGTDVTVNTSGLTTGTLLVGQGGAAADLPSGKIDITSTGAAYTATTANTTLGAVTSSGGSSVVINQSASSSEAAAATDTANTTITQSAITVTGGAATTSVEVNQDLANTAVNYVAAVTGVKQVDTVTFVAMAATETITVGGLIFTASKTLTAAEAAAAFANLSAGDTQGPAPAGNGVYSGTFGAYSTGAVTTTTTSSTVKATASVAAGAAAAITVADTAGAGNVTSAAGTGSAAAVTAVTGEMGIVNGAVVVNGAITGTDVLTDVTLDGYGAASTVASDALSTMTLKNSGQGLTATSAGTGAVTLNLDNITGGAAISVDGTAATLTGITINASGKKSTADVIADAATTVTIDAGVALDLSGSSFTAATTATITGAGAVTLDEDGGGASLVTIDASGSTGGVTATAQTWIAGMTFTGGSGADSVKLGASTKTTTMGAGDDTVVMTAALGTGGSINGGDDTDTLSMTVAIADAADASAVTWHTNMERLLLNNAAGDNDNTADTVTLDVEALGFTNYVKTNGTVLDTTTAGRSDTLAISNLASGGTVEVLASAAGANSKHTVAIKNAATGTADVLNLTLTNAASTNFGTVTAASTETVNVSSNNVDAGTTGSVAETQTVVLTAAAAKTVTVSGSNKITLTLTGSTATTTIDASSNTGGVTVTSANTTSAVTLTGGSGGDTLEGAASGDVLLGNDGADQLTAGNLTTMTGGAGNDTFVLGTAPTSLNTYATVTDFSVGDVLDTTATSMGATKVTLASTASFQDYANAAVDGTSAAKELAWFQYGGDTYVVVDNATGGATFVNGTDFIIKLTGLIDLSQASFNKTNGTVELPGGGG